MDIFKRGVSEILHCVTLCITPPPTYTYIEEKVLVKDTILNYNEFEQDLHISFFVILRNGNIWTQ